MKIWDFLFLEGEIVLFKSCLAIIKGLAKKMIGLTNFGKNYLKLEDAYIFMSSYKFEFKEYAWDLLYFLIMKRFNFDMEFIKRRREIYQKPIVMNLEHENQIRICNRKRNKSIFKFFADVEKKENKICNKDNPVCLYNQYINRKNILMEYWIITRKNQILIEKNYIHEDYFFNIINTHKQKEKILEESNVNCFESAKSFLEKFEGLDLNYPNNKTNSDQLLEDYLKLGNITESEVEDLKEIKKIKQKSSVFLDKLDLKNLEIVNLNLKGHENNSLLKNSLNLITNYDKLQNFTNEVDVIDDLMIERHIHVCPEHGKEINASNKINENNKNDHEDIWKDNLSNLDIDKINIEQDFEEEMQMENDNREKEENIKRIEFDFGNRSDFEIEI